MSEGVNLVQGLYIDNTAQLQVRGLCYAGEFCGKRSEKCSMFGVRVGTQVHHSGSIRAAV